MNYVKLFVFNFYSCVFFLIYSAVCIPVLAILVAFMSLFMNHRATMKRFRRAIAWWGRGITLIPFPFIKVNYENHSGEASGGPCIIVCNHRSASDGFLMSLLDMEVVQVVNIWPFRIPVIGFFGRAAGYLNIRMMKPEEFFERALLLLGQNVSIIFFPEGTRSVTGKLGSFHSAAFRLALKSRAPIVPLCISGSETILPKGSLLLRPGTVRVRRLPAITWSEYKELSVYTLKNRVKEIIGSELALMEQGA